ncbi:MAG: hypothetical protein EHM80_16080 [Nitrospiraceae bacterium]|nr:MAG: hypothetical protein EHM80_16080 [Nitrospiraceae bacterium]
MKYATVEILTLDPLPCWSGLSEELYRERIASLVEQIEAEARAKRESNGKRALGPCGCPGTGSPRRQIYKAHPIADGGLHSHVPARPGWTTPHIWFLFVAPQFWNQASFRPHLAVTPLPYPSLRLCEHLARGLSPLQFCAMPGTHGDALHRRTAQPAVRCKRGLGLRWYGLDT